MSITRIALLAACMVPFALHAEEPAVINPPLTVRGQASTSASGLAEDDTSGGAYGQPEWLGARRFATTRAYIQQNPWEFGVEQWWRSRKNGDDWSHKFQEEIELGLPYRFQLDFYYDWTYEDSHSDFEDVAAEVRWAFADWGKIPLNPTLYFEYKWVDAENGGNVVEPKLLLAEDFGCGWHWAANFVWEKELTDSKAEEWAFTQAISKSIIDSKLSVGIEMTYKWETAEGSRDNPEKKFNIGPSIQWRPTECTHVDLVGLAGLTNDSPDFEGWLVLGWDFGSGESHFKPVTRRQ
jgi:hypothetical protein